MNTFTAGSCIQFGWDTFKKRPWFFIGATLLYLVVIAVVVSLLNELIVQGGILAFIGTIARLAVQMLISMGVISFALKAHDDVEHVSIMDLWHPRPFWKYIGASLLFGLIFVVGLILVIIPGIIWGIMFGFAVYLVIDKNMWPIEALKESKRITYGYKWELFLLGILSFLVALLGIICLGVGLLVAYPVIIFANVHAYRVLSQRAGTSTTSSAM
jgi:uncharacterized membrane protein